MKISRRPRSRAMWKDVAEGTCKTMLSFRRRGGGLKVMLTVQGPTHRFTVYLDEEEWDQLQATVEEFREEAARKDCDFHQGFTLAHREEAADGASTD